MFRSIAAFLLAPFPAALFQAIVVAIWPKAGTGVFEHPSSMFVAICLTFYIFGSIFGLPLWRFLRKRRPLTLRNHAFVGMVAMAFPVILGLGWVAFREGFSAYIAIYNISFFAAGGAAAGALFYLVRHARKAASASYAVTDPRPIAADAPYTFFLPTANELAAIGPSDLVKLMFDYPHQTAKWAAERMWVTVTEADGDLLRGTLANQPDEPTSPLVLGNEVVFQRHNVLAIEWEHPETAPASPSQKEYWDRCLVDDCILDGLEPVEYIYREEPDMQQDGDTYPDSGWRIRGRQGPASDADMEARKFSYVALGAVLNRDDSWLRWIDAPIGTALMRDFDRNIYVARE